MDPHPQSQESFFLFLYEDNKSYCLTLILSLSKLNIDYTLFVGVSHSYNQKRFIFSFFCLCINIWSISNFESEELDWI